MKTALHFDAAPEPGDFFFGSILGQGSYAKVCTLLFHVTHMIILFAF
jgi:hypothetical protein